MEQDLLVEKHGRVLVLTMHRPERRNALTRPMTDAMGRAVRDAAEDPQVGAIVLTGTPPGFCAGGDVKNMAEAPHAGIGTEERIAILRERADVSRLLHEIGKPTIAMIRGAAAGAGLSLALACDLRIAAASAKLTTAFIKVGTSGDFGGHFFVNRLVGSAKARELFLLAPVLDAAEALRIGLLTQVHPDDAVLDATMTLAHAIADGPSVAYALMKRNLNIAESATLAETLDAESRHMILSQLTEDHLEAARAFAQKRPAKFVGR
ncbi:MAG: enoyl-CoA hydratase-related protein [Lautropia sp.]